MNHVTTYRPDIDGLRAIAVIAVIFFHASLGFPGGFVGVDIFFVISGYLITNLILKDLATEPSKFSMSHFWERRVCRIIPAASVVVGLVFVASFFILLPDDLINFGKGVVAQATMLANIYFFQKPDGYFDARLDDELLLHFWSLAVEEQFYLLFPVLLVFWVKRKKQTLGLGLIVLFLFSIVLSFIGIIFVPKATFYLLPTRAWELLLGALLAFHGGSFSVNKLMRDFMGWSGVGLLAFSFFAYNRTTVFPGFAAIPPCLGTALIIFSSQSEPSTVGRILSLRPFVIVGLLSYSLYLWHWPLLVFAKYLGDNQLWPFRVAILALSGSFAFLTWRVVELPMRTFWQRHSRRQVYLLAGLTILGMIVAGYSVEQFDGLPGRFSATSLEYAKSRTSFQFRNSVDLEQARRGDFPQLGETDNSGRSSILLWGDSHAMSLAPILDYLGKTHKRKVVQATMHGTPPLSIAGNLNNSDAAFSFGNSVMELIRRDSIKDVIITANWKFYVRDQDFAQKMVETVRNIQALGARVYVVQGVPDQQLNVPRVSALTENYGGDVDKIGVSPEAHRKQNSLLNNAYSAISELGGELLNPADFFLNSNGIYGVRRDGKILYIDSNHLSVAGSQILGPLLEPIFTNER